MLNDAQQATVDPDTAELGRIINAELAKWAAVVK